MDRLAVFHCAAALAFAGVLASTAIVAGLAAALALAGVLARAVVGFAFAFVGVNDAGMLGRGGCRGRGLHGCTGENAGDSGSREECLLLHGFGWFVWF